MISLFFCAVLSASPSKACDDSLPFRISRVQTELQRLLLSVASQDHAVFSVVLDGNQAMKDMEGSAADLAETFFRIAPAGGLAHVQTILEAPFPSNESRATLQRTLLQALQEVDFRMQYQSTSTSEKGAFKNKAGALPVVAESEDLDEPLGRNSLGLAGRVRTSLSRHLTGGADLFLQIRQPLRQSESYLNADQEEVLLALLDSVGGAPAKVSVVLDIMIAEGNGSREAYDRLTETLGSHDYEVGSFTTSLQEDPRADEWIGKAVPDVSLIGLDGSASTLADQVAGKVALITFWGVG